MRPPKPKRGLHGPGRSSVMDLISIAIALVVFVALYFLIDGLDRDMSFAEGSLLVVSILLFIYLLYALLRGEKL